jgi:hypothetical protein
MWTANAINEHMSSAESDSEVDANVDRDDEISDLSSNIKPTIFTSHGHPSATLQHDRPYDPGRARETNTYTTPALNHSDSDPDGDEEANTTAQSDPIVSSDKLSKYATRRRHDPAKQKISRDLRKASGAHAKCQLCRRLADYEKVIGSDIAPKLWGGKTLGDDASLRELNIRLRKMIKKQVKLHELLRTAADSNITYDLRQRLQPWSADNIDGHETQLDTFISAAAGLQNSNPRKSTHNHHDTRAES